MSRILVTDHDEWPWPEGNGAPKPVPRELFVQGCPIPATSKCVAVVGTRRASAAGLALAKTFGKRFAEAGYAVVSGMARGIDTAAHRGALEAGGHTIAVVGCGLDLTYPPRNAALKAEIAARGTLVSEYPPGTEPRAFHFPERNRIIAALSKGVLVVEGGLKSGSLITARLAVDLDRWVWAIPGSPHDPRAAGPNELIRVGEGSLVCKAEHVFEDLAPQLAWSSEYSDDRRDVVELTDDQIEVLVALGAVPMTPDQLCSATSLTLGRLGLALAKLEVRGFAQRSRGGGYQISPAGGRALGLVMANGVG
ncbi:MAG TPA: DNA-processing protein DprA, partial [Actinomycetota bacterium]|nr:DNA-processing protein DprA [Actinomycetota bacterium]